MSQAYETARIVITRELHPGDDGDLVRIELSEDITALEALGMLEMAKDYVLRDRVDDE